MKRAALFAALLALGSSAALAAPRIARVARKFQVVDTTTTANTLFFHTIGGSTDPVCDGAIDFLRSQGGQR